MYAWKLSISKGVFLCLIPNSFWFKEEQHFANHFISFSKCGTRYSKEPQRHLSINKWTRNKPNTVTGQPFMWPVEWILFYVGIKIINICPDFLSRSMSLTCITHKWLSKWMNKTISNYNIRQIFVEHDYIANFDVIFVRYQSKSNNDQYRFGKHIHVLCVTYTVYNNIELGMCYKFNSLNWQNISKHSILA